MQHERPKSGIERQVEDFSLTARRCGRERTLSYAGLTEQGSDPPGSIKIPYYPSAIGRGGVRSRGLLSVLLLEPHLRALSARRPCTPAQRISHAPLPLDGSNLEGAGALISMKRFRDPSAEPQALSAMPQLLNSEPTAHSDKREVSPLPRSTKRLPENAGATEPRWGRRFYPGSPSSRSGTDVIIHDIL
jgi:hypothetical protein